ncbi:MAG: phosphotransferase [Candidatus Bathyarchaeia archaeon]
MPELPTQLWNRDFMKDLFRENFKQLFYDPRHWRLPPKDIKQVQIHLLNFSPPEYDILIAASATLGKVERTLYFYEAVIAKKELAKGERTHGKVQINESNIYFIDSFTSRRFLKKLLEMWCQGKKLDSLGFIGSFLEVTDEAKVKIKMLRPFFKPEEEATTNYLYRCKGLAKTLKGEMEFDIVIKRFLPREPADRGNREYEIARVLPPEIVPKVHGGLVNHAFTINGKPQVLVLFINFIQDMEIGKEIWNLMEEIAHKEDEGSNHRKQLEQLHRTVQEAIDKVIFPFHQSCFNAWYPLGRTIQPQDEYHQRYYEELRKNLTTLKNAGLITEEERNKFTETFTQAWERILRDVKATEIHGDLMWRQIMKTKKGNLVILDLDEHVMGHAGKDLADVCAANRFIAEDLPCLNKDYVRDVAENLNQLILEYYLKNAEKTKAGWIDKLRETVLVYLAHRHLHDAAYYAPAWQEATDDEKRVKYRKYVDFSINWFKRSLNQLERVLRSV